MQFLKKIAKRLLKNEEDEEAFVKIIFPSLIIHGLAALLAFTLIFVLTRKLGVRQYGIYTYALAVAGVFINLNAFGVNVLALRETSSLLSQDKKSQWKGFYKWAFKTVFISSILVTSAGLLFIGISSHLSLVLKGNTYTVPVLFAFLLVPFFWFMNFYSALLKGVHKPVISLLPDNTIKPFIFLCLLISFTFITGKLNASKAILLHICAVAVAFVFAAIFFTKNTSFKKIQAESVSNKWRSSLWSFAAITGITGIASHTDIFMLGFLKDASSVGIYGSADKITGFLTVFISIMVQLFSATVAKLNTLNEKQKLQKVITKTIRWVFIGSVPFYLFAIIMSKWIMLYCGKDFASGQTALIILATGRIISIAFGPVGMVSMMSGNEKTYLTFMGMCLVLNILLNLVLVPLLGINGTAIASSAVLIFWNYCMFINVKNKTGIRTWILG
jgi:O-antigen/teichoic acid export membrane protein